MADLKIESDSAKSDFSFDGELIHDGSYGTATKFFGKVSHTF